MIVGVPREIMKAEHRVAITPVGVRELTDLGHTVLVEQLAGDGSTIADSAFEREGARLVPTAEEVWGEADLILKVKEPQASEFALLRQGQILFTFLHLAAHKDVTEALAQSGCTAIAYETVETVDGRLPLLAPMSEIAGRMAPHVAATHLHKEHQGSGVLMGGVSGVRPARVLVIGAGMAGANAAWIAQGMEAEVTLLDRNVERLRYVDHIHKGRILTLASAGLTIEEQLTQADVVIAAVLVAGARAPKLTSDDVIARMQPGSVIVDISIDQGGAFPTSRVTTHTHPTYVTHGVVHYCVGNMPGAVPHTSTYALTNATLPYVVALAGAGFEEAVRMDPALAKGVNVFEGSVTNAAVAEALSMEFQPLASLSGGK